MVWGKKPKKAVEPEEPEPQFDDEVDCEAIETSKPKQKQAPAEAEPQFQLVSHEQLVLVRLDQLEAKMDKILKLAAE